MFVYLNIFSPMSFHGEVINTLEAKIQLVYHPGIWLVTTHWTLPDVEMPMPYLMVTSFALSKCFLKVVQQYNYIPFSF